MSQLSQPQIKLIKQTIENRRKMMKNLEELYEYIEQE